MKIVVIGGSGLIGRHLTTELARQGHEAIAASPSTGVNALTGEGLTDVLHGADVVVDVSNSPSFEDAAVLEFFERSGRNLLAAELGAGVRHHVVLSIVGTDRLEGNGYFRAKVVQERLIRDSGIPFTIVRATQFFEFVATIAEASVDGGRIIVPDADFQPIAAVDVAAALADAALAPPRNATIEIAGPDRLPFRDFVASGLAANGDNRQVLADRAARYFGTALEVGSLVPEHAGAARLGRTRFKNWLTAA
ncbi:SDR family oxidoreductase [Aureimonas altamirensis]|uniref:SDR family oxidoreductase n=1 Tax=Aureimonas TaxID=414371 RepID=UPI001782DB43|nr:MULTISPECIES: SDR family oxidoreductase [Aureimonas]MCM2504271.1 SDR family oxidoreductase [Aureimonas altamirensis]QOG05186.1 SDR family oxidoreductase [Aureimonas sp. OT7]